MVRVGIEGSTKVMVVLMKVLVVRMLLRMMVR